MPLVCAAAKLYLVASKIGRSGWGNIKIIQLVYGH